jgi:excisionase family DNA binding protein
MGHHATTAGPPGADTARLLDINQTAQLLNTTPRFVRRLVQERRIPYLKVGRYIRFDPTDLDTWLDHCRQTPLT